MIDKLLSISEPWLQYAIKATILNEKAENLESLKKTAMQEKIVRTYLTDITDFFSTLITNHKNPALPIHKLLFLLDIGFGMDIPEIEDAINQLMSHRDKYGVYQSLTNIPAHYGGSGKNTFGWCLCDAPLLLTALVKAKVDYPKHIKQGVDHLLSLQRSNGFPCSVSDEFGNFRGPGRKDDCCPYATLAMLNLLSCMEEYRNSGVAIKGVDAILSLWENSMQRHPYMFYMGTDFRKLKAPAIWYDIVSVCDCLSKYPYARSDARFREMTELIKAKQDDNGFFTPESIYQKCKAWDFGQKKSISPYLSFLCLRILGRITS